MLSKYIKALKRIEEQFACNPPSECGRTTLGMALPEPGQSQIARFVVDDCPDVIDDVHYVLTHVHLVVHSDPLDDHKFVIAGAAGTLKRHGFTIQRTTLDNGIQTINRTIFIDVQGYRLYLFAQPSLQKHLLKLDSQSRSWLRRLLDRLFD